MSEKVSKGIKADIKKALGTYPEECTVDGNTVIIELQDISVTYKMLDNLSDLLKTDDINLSTETREGGYCETCHYTYTVTIITAYNCKLE